MGPIVLYLFNVYTKKDVDGQDSVGRKPNTECGMREMIISPSLEVTYFQIARALLLV